jgi:phenylpropionate dioxygenase-like ring-hydroxylating dioxygenase large terminal subunit
MTESSGPRSYQDLLDTDTHEVPVSLRRTSTAQFDDTDIPVTRYTTREFHDLEVERLWRRVWQFACREEELPHVGSFVVYDIAHLSFIIMRTAPDTIKAYVNACLHRGRQLKDHHGRCTELRCSYHGFAWALDGRLADVPARWDFPHVHDDEFGLPEAQVAVWQGFVFINPDPAAAPFAEFAAGLDEHFDRWNLRDRYIQAHVSKVVRANWKVVQEAFSEAYHVNATHPQTLVYLDDVSSQVDVWTNFARVITAAATASPLLYWTPTPEEVLRHLLDVREDEPTPFPVPEGTDARALLASITRARMRAVVGDEPGTGVDTWSDAEYLDNIYYTLFPNFHPWGAFNRIVYRFRPNGDDHTTAIMDVYFLSPFRGERPAPAPTTHLGPDQPWTDAPELGMLAKVFEQDTFNLPKVQKGLRQTVKPGITLGHYQESKVRWLQHRLAEWLGV